MVQTSAAAVRVVPSVKAVNPSEIPPPSNDDAERAVTAEAQAQPNNDLAAYSLETSAGTAIRDAVRRAPSSQPERKISAIVEDVKAAFQRVNEAIVGREELITQTMLALLTREHQLIYSRAGMAKSLLAQTTFNQFTGGRLFSIQLTKGTTEEAVVGGVNIEELKKGNIIHNVTNSLVDATFAYLDELFDANDVTLRSTLGIMNERKFTKGKQCVDAVLHSAIATTNYLRSTDITEAVLDRFVFKARLLPDADPLHQAQVDKIYEQQNGKASIPPPEQRVPVGDLGYLADIVEGKVPGKEIVAPGHILALKNAIIQRYTELLTEKYKELNLPPPYVSPRTMAKSRDVLNASALLANRKQLVVKDLTALKYMIPVIGDQLQTETFGQAMNEVLAKTQKTDIPKLDRLVEADDIVQALVQYHKDGIEPAKSLLDRIKLFFGFTTIGSLTFERIGEEISKVDSSSTVVTNLKAALLQEIAEQKNRMDGAKRGLLW